MNKNNHILENQWWKLEIQNNGNEKFFYKLKSKTNEVTYADQDYHYDILPSVKRGLFFKYDWYEEIMGKKEGKNLASRLIQMDGEDTLTIKSKFHKSYIEVIHKFKLKKEDKWLREFITLINQGKKKARLARIDFGFKKALFRQHEGWVDHLDEYQLTAIPTRRFVSLGNDRRKEAFSANDLLYGPILVRGTEMPGFCSEGWLWGNSEGGLLTCKYNPSELEFSRFSRLPTLLPGRGLENTDILFGGAYLCQGNPEAVTSLNPGQDYTFGISKYAIYEGDYRNGYYLYRNHLEEKGHRFTKEYNPPVNWNELYNLGWVSETYTNFYVNVDKSKFEVYKLDDLYNEADIARDIGAECLYLDPGWNTFLGSEIWNEERFGTLKEFSKIIHEKYGLKLGLHLMMHFASPDEPEDFYLTTRKGARLVSDPFLGLYALCANEKWVQEKSRRILELAKEGVDFLMFDFTEFSSFIANKLGCFSPDHGHEVPMRRQTHVTNIFKVIQNIKREYPNILIEAHDRGVDNQLYFQHGLPHSFDENWGFEYMWNPMQDLLSLKAISLYEYNLAYSIPLYLHVNENSDNENMLQFWWYASTARHLGIGGLKDRNSTKYKALKNAMILYKKIKPILTRGIFYGIDPMIHLHVNEDSGNGVITAFNLTSRDKRLKIKIDLQRYDMRFKTIEIYNGINKKIKVISKSHKPNNILEFKVEIPTLTPMIVIFV